MRAAAGGALLLALAACAGGSSDAPSPLPPPPADEVTPDKPLAELPVQKMKPGQCGLVLWQRAEPARRIFFASSDPAEARIMRRGKPVRLGRTDMSGGMMFGHAPRQRYDGVGVSVRIEIDIKPRAGLANGAVVPAGTLTYQRTGADAVVLPVVGLIGCN